jgi:hypothetical protein
MKGIGPIRYRSCSRGALSPRNERPDPPSHRYGVAGRAVQLQRMGKFKPR